MRSPLLALFAQSLSQDAYGKPTYWVRTGVCALAILLLFMIAKESGWGGAPGLIIFTAIVILQMVAISLIGLSYFGSAIAEEKEEQTLGLLRMTALNSISILLGKSTSRLCGALLLLAAAFPFTIISITLGGISLDQILASYCTMAAYTFLICNVALLGSVLGRHTGVAATFTTVVIGALLGIGPLLKEIGKRLPDADGLSTIGETLWDTTPIARLREILATHYAGPPAGWQVAIDLALGVACFLLAWAAFGHFCERTGASDAAGESMRFLGMRLRRPPRVRTHAIGWKDFYFLCDGVPGLVFRVLGYLVFPVLALAPKFFGSAYNFESRISKFDTWLGLIFFLDIGVVAARIFRSELNDQTLSSLATLPSSIRSIAYRKARLFLLVALPGSAATTWISVLKIGFDGYRGTYFSNPLMTTMAASANIATTALFVHVVIWASLLMKRGALPTSIVFMLVLSALLDISGGSLGFYLSQKIGDYALFNFATFSFFVSTFVGISFSLFLHFRSLRRLEALAGEG